ncbi:MAG: hypothetical protein JWP97_1445 [Labilithrix sp.]|nr:hypothetical protein [Labilithrix sp.]
MVSGALTERQLEEAQLRWREHDAAQALHPGDARVAASADALRALVLEHLAGDGSPRDLYSACARLGRLLAERGATPTLVAVTLDGAVAALGLGPRDPRLGPARASLAEGHAAAILDAEQERARQAWEYPACAVRISRETVAIAAGYPVRDGDDPEVASEWAARVALRVSKDGYVRAILGGTAGPRAELEAALALVGVRSVEDAEASRGGTWTVRLAGIFKRP